MILNKEKDQTEQLKKCMTQLPIKETLHLNKILSSQVWVCSNRSTKY